MANNNKIKNDLLYLFDRPCEPIFTKRGQDVSYSVPNDYLTDRYKPLSTNLSNRFGEVGDSIPVKKITLPDFTPVMALRRDQEFSLWIPKHRKIASRCIDIFMGMRTLEDLQSACVYARDRVNPSLFQYSLACAMIHRPDTKNIPIPSLIEMFPYKFVDSKIIQNIKEETFILDENMADDRQPIEVPRDYTASDLDPEHRLWYFREDPGVNLHHWHWHLVYPYEATNLALVNKDRRGELFYYAHEQIMARYNFERLANQLQRTKRFGQNFRDRMDEGYFPKMDSSIASRSWPARPDNAFLQDIDREIDQIKVDVSQMENWREKIFDAINRGWANNTTGGRVMLSSDGNTDTGIDVLGNMVESSILSPNRQLYGDMHNFGHVFISYAHDPTYKHLESFGLINEPGTAMRDPMFYRFHAFINDLFQRYKELQQPYTTEQLTFNNIRVDDVKVQSSSGSSNTLQTFWNKSDVDFSRGLDFQPRGNVFVRFTHLNHNPFVYNIQINNLTNQNRLGMCRIFLAPRFDERGLTMLLRDQRLLMVEMDKFIVQLNPGVNVIRQASTQSTVTIPFEQTFRNVDANRPAVGTAAAEDFNICGCGWPQHMLVPRGTAGGMECDLFVMISDYELDGVNQDLAGVCRQAAAYCGIRDRLYPDRRPMGYPFDRLPRIGADTLQQFLTPNMRSQVVVINHQNAVLPRPQ